MFSNMIVQQTKLVIYLSACFDVC